MIIFLAVIIVIAIIVIIFFLYKIVTEQNTIIEETEQIEKNDIAVKRIRGKNLGIISDDDFEKLLAEAHNNPDKLEELKIAVQNTLRKDVKEKNVAHARICNENLKKIDAIEKKGTQK